MRVPVSLPPPKIDCQRSVNDVWSRIMDNSRAVQRHTLKITILAAFLGKNASADIATTSISNDPSFRQKLPGVPDGSDGSDGTSYPLTENYTLPVAQVTRCIADIPPLLFGDVYAQLNDTCVTRFTVAAVMLKPFTQRLAMFMPFSGRCFFGNAAGALGNRSYYLSFNDFQNLCIQFVFSSMYLCYLYTHGISGLAARGDCQRFEVPLKMTIE